MSNRENNEERGGLLLAKEPSQLILPLDPRRTGRTATRPPAYRTHCHSTPIVPIRYARCRLAVHGALPSTFTGEWQCEWHCHSAMSVPFAPPLALERSDAVRSVPLGSEYYTATRP